MFRLARFIVALCLTAVVLAAALPARAFETQASAAWVYDMTTNTVLLDKQGEVPLPPSSMSKLMTLNMLFEALKDGRVTMDTTFAVSEKAWKMGGSKMFVKPGDLPTVEDLIHGIIINSGNDACVVVAEGLAGSEDYFAELMTARAQALGMDHSTFANSSGWPDPAQRMSAQDLGRLAVHLITEFPEYYPFFAMSGFNYKDRVPSNGNNRNPMLRVEADGTWSADGLKTGHTEEGGYGLVGSAVHKDGRRIIIVLNGLASEADRARESEAIANWAFRQFALKTVVKAGSQIATADVFMGNAKTVGLVPATDLRLLVPAIAQDGISAEVVYTGPIRAPIAKGTKLADLIVRIPGLPDGHVDLVAETDIGPAGFMDRVLTAADHLRARYLDG